MSMAHAIDAPAPSRDNALASAATNLIVERCTGNITSDHKPTCHPSYDLRWLQVLHEAFGHSVYQLTVRDGDQCRGNLSLALVSSRLFGRFLVSLPYVNVSGVQADDVAAKLRLVDEAAALADELDCRYLEFRHEETIDHPQLTEQRTDKCLMRLSLPAGAEALWEQLDAKVRNQVRKGQRANFEIQWGRHEQLDGFYEVFARTMRDLGTPVFGRRFFAAILDAFGADAELCVVRDGRKPVAGAVLVHGTEVTEVPSAAALHDYHPTNVNMLMYWHLLGRAIERGSRVFDFGRSTRDSGTYRFKKQWGAEPHPSVWQYYVRHGSMNALRPDNTGNRRLISIWKRLPVWLTRAIGPSIVRGIP